MTVVIQLFETDSEISDISLCYAFCRRACNPVDLFDAAVQKQCPEDFVRIKVIILSQNSLSL